MPETQNQFVTYVKATLSCSVKTDGNRVYYNELGKIISENLNVLYCPRADSECIVENK